MLQQPPIEIPQDVRELVRRTLGGVRAGEPTVGHPGHRFSISPAEMPVPPIVHWLLREVLGCADLGPAEKVAWRLCLAVGGTPAGLSLEKFGVWLWIDEAVDEETARGMRDRVVDLIDRAVRAVEVRILDPYLEAELAHGHVIVRNQMARLRGAYEYFRCLADEADMPASETSPATNSAEPAAGDASKHEEMQAFFQGIAERWNRRVHEHNARFYCTIAMLNAYFSMLEHLLVLIWPFFGYQPGVDNVRDFIRKTLMEKFKVLFPAEAARDGSAYTALRDVAQRYRNTFDHGGFDREGATLYVRIPDAGFVPSSMSQVRGSVHFGLFPIERPDFEEACSAVDLIEGFLESGPLAHAVKLARSGFDIPFFEDELRPMRDAVDGTDEELEAWMDAEAQGQDFLDNMEW